MILRTFLRYRGRTSSGSLVVYFTGSKAHNVTIRTIAAKRGLKINEYGVFEGTRRIAGQTEEESPNSITSGSAFRRRAVHGSAVTRYSTNGR